MKLPIRLFGAFRKYADGSELELELPEECNLASLKKALAAHLAELDPNFSDHALILDSAFADEKNILTEQDMIVRGTKLAILPPVCGG